MLGSRPLEDIIGRGRFYCPECKKLRNYNKKVIRRYQTVLFIPIFPIKKLAKYVECQACFGIFEVDILSKKLPAMTKNPLSHESILLLWKQLYERTACEEVAQGKKWSVSVTSCATALQKAGAHIFSRDYDKAREYLHHIVYEAQSLNVSLMDMSAKKINLNIPERYLKKQSEIYLAAKEILQNMP